MFEQSNSNLFQQSEKIDQYDDKTKPHVQSSSNKSQMLINYKDLLNVVWCILTVIPVLLYSAIIKLFKSPKSLQGKICLVTGAGRGLGRELCLQLAALGAEIVCVDIREETNNETVKLIKESGGKAHGYICNVSKYDEVTKLAETVQKEVGRVYLLINNAALVMTHKAGDWPPEDITAMFNVNVISHFWTIRAFLPAMKKFNEGHIVNMVSISSLAPILGLSLYGATKSASECMISTMRLELNCNEDNKIILTSVHPVVVNTSEDIQYMYSKGNFHMLQTEYVVKEIIEGIKYDETYVVIPKLYRYVMLCLRLLPDIISINIYKTLKICVSIPSEQCKQTLLFKKIQQKCL